MYGFSLAKPSAFTKISRISIIEYYELEDTVKVNQLIISGYQEIKAKKADLSISIAQEAYFLSIKNAYTYGLAHSYLIMAKAYNQKKAYPQSLSYYLKSLAEFEKSKNTLTISNINYEIGMMYSNWQVYDKAIKYFRVSNQLNKQINDELNSIISIQATAFTFIHLNQPDSAIFYYSKNGY